MFVRVIRPINGRDTEVLVNLAHVSTIEIHYMTEGGWAVDPRASLTNPDLVRVYKFFVAGESYLAQANPNSRVATQLQKIYFDAVADSEPSSSGDGDRLPPDPGPSTPDLP